MKKIFVVFSWSIFISPLFISENSLLAQCIDNDECTQALDIPNLISNQPFLCLEGCNEFASPEVMDNSCMVGLFPTVWYKLNVDTSADVLNIIVTSTEFDQPVISLYKSDTDCEDLFPVPFTGANVACAIGTNGQVEAVGTAASSQYTYYIAVSSFNSAGGDFTICVSTKSQSSVCVLDRNIEVVARSNGGPLEGPFDPYEKVSICMNVNDYTAVGNGCQWFQGIVPVFGNGWDPNSFDANGQPFNASVNGNPFGQDGNGLYGASIWDWFTDVDYHYDNPNMTIADLDGNGRIDMCNSKYEMDCPQVGAIGGCCGPCWDTALGSILPGGWFAYGINGTCGTPGPPIRVDWGDGNTCGHGMGPWKFCFDLVTRDIPDCMTDSTTRDLSLGFFTMADGEIGSWTGNASVCANDHPVKLSLQAKCGRININDVEPLPSLCSGDTLKYFIEEPEVIGWEWNISPFWAAPYLVNHAENGFQIEAPLINSSDEPVEIKGVLIGNYGVSGDVIIRRFQFTLNTFETCLVGINDPAPKVENKIRIYPTPANESAILEWAFRLKRDAKIRIYNSQGALVKEMQVSTEEGYQKQIDTQFLSPGVYLVSLSNGDVSGQAKLVKL